jgi:hypothetical protein
MLSSNSQDTRRAEHEAIKRQRLWSKSILYYLWRWSVGYGVQGWRLLIWAALIILPTSIAISWFYYWNSSVSPLRKFFPKGLFYTLWLFLPIDFKISELEQVSLEPRSLFILVKFFTKVSGWIIVPLAVAQIGGFLKKKD